MRPYCAALLLFTVFHVPVAVAKNIATILAARLISGMAGSAAFAIRESSNTLVESARAYEFEAPAMSVDFLTPAQRLFCVNFFMTCTFVGPAAGPIAGTYLAVNYGWRWTAWVSLAVAGSTSSFAALAIRESCADILLQRKAAKLRKELNDDSVRSKRDENPVDGHALVTKYLTRPMGMFVRDPIVSPF